MVDDKSKKIDMVNSPSHYKHGGIECIDYLQAKLSSDQFEGFLLGNVIKYMSRSQHKGKRDQDYEKAQWYNNKLVEFRKSCLEKGK
jgi:hypothetical protein